MFNFILWPSNIIFLLCVHVLEKRKKIGFQPGKEMPQKKGKYLSLEMLPAPVQGSIPSPIAAQDMPAEHHVPAGARSHHLALLAPRHWHWLRSRSSQRAQTRCCFCWVVSLLFLLAEGSEVVQLQWSWQGAEGMGWLLLPACSHPKVTWLLSLGAVRRPRVGCIQRRRRAREAQGWCL